MTRTGMGGKAAAIVKYLLFIAFVAMLAARSMAGGSISAAPFDDVKQAVLSAASLDEMSQADNQMIRRLYKLDPDEYEGVLLCYPNSLMGVQEILLVKLADVSQQDTVREAIASRLQTQINTFEGYGPEQVALLERAVTEVRGNYILFVVAEDTSVVSDAFLQAL